MYILYISYFYFCGERDFYATNIVAYIPENSRLRRNQYSCVYAASKRNVATPKYGKSSLPSQSLKFRPKVKVFSNTCQAFSHFFFITTDHPMGCVFFADRLWQREGISGSFPKNCVPRFYAPILNWKRILFQNTKETKNNKRHKSAAWNQVAKAASTAHPNTPQSKI